MTPDGDIDVAASAMTWPLRAGGDECAWLRLFNDSTARRTVVTTVGETARRSRLEAGAHMPQPLQAGLVRRVSLPADAGEIAQ